VSIAASEPEYLQNLQPAAIPGRPALFVLCAICFATCLLLGGGTRPGLLSDVVLQVVALPSLLLALWWLSEITWTPQLKRALLFCSAIVALPLIQLIPLPPSVWTALPHRAYSTTAYALLGQTLPWLPLSVSPHATWLSLNALIPPLAVFLNVVLLDYRQRQLLSLLLLGLGFVSVCLALLQVAQGENSWLRFYEFTNFSEAVGFFANRNHFAAFLYCLVLVAAAWATNAALSATKSRLYAASTLIPLILSFTMIVVLIAGQLMARSRAGLGLTIVALLASLALAASDRRSIAGGLNARRLIFAAVALAALLTTQFALYRIMDRFTPDPLADWRIPFARNTMTAARAYMPFGSGMGTFVPVYALFEPREDVFTAFANRAHNDILEVWLEGGVLALMLMAVFTAWLVARAYALWRSSPVGHAPIDQLLARAAVLILVLLIVHACVDYAFRTAAIMAVFAFACGLLVPPPPDARVSPEPAFGSPEGPLPAVWPAHAPRSSRGSQDNRWGEDIEWPEEWR
jgi:O-antigen ligase